MQEAPTGFANGASNGTATAESEKEAYRTDHLAPRTSGFYAAAAVALLVYSITPLSWFTVLWRYYRTGSILSLPHGVTFKIWYCQSLAEVAFSIYFQYLMWRGSQRLPPPKVDGETLSRLITKCLMVGLPKEQQEQSETGGKDLFGLPALQSRRIDEVEASTVQRRLQIWFHFAPLEDIYADNLREWLSWAFASRPLEDVKADKEMSMLIDEGLEMIKHRLNWTGLKEGYNPNVRAIRLTLDEMRVLSRPLGYYVVCNGTTHAVMAWMRLFHGFRLEKSGQCSFLVKRPTTSTKKERDLPVLFMHGLGIGIGQYIAFLKRLVKHEDGVVILVQPHISGDITHPNFLNPPSKDEQADATASLLRRLDMPKVTTLSHSNGTMVLGWLLRSYPEVCAKNILVDPVSFRLWEGSVCYSFVYRRWITFIEVLLGYFVARELGTARTIGRNFQWSDMCLWVDDFISIHPDNFHVVFGEKDLLVDVPSCVAYLRESGIPDECITVVPDYQHGKALMFEGTGMQLVARKAGITL